jgi:hypothetical protein
VIAVLSGCASHPVYKDEKFAENTPYSKKMGGSGEVVCWSVKRAFLTQGYMLERSSDPVIVTGAKDVQNDETNETVRMQATCVDNHDGTSTVFSTATYEVSSLQRSAQSMSAGVSLATITLPTGTDKALRLQSRETIKDAKFYERFYTLVQQFAAEDQQGGGASVGGSRRR